MTARHFDPAIVMPLLFAELFFFLLVILAAAEIFTNALEHLGEKLHISEGVTGSLFAAVGTALPETLVPILAIIGGTADQAVNHEIGVGAILGAPLMLGTLTCCMMAIAALRQRGLHGHIRPEPTGLKRDLSFFLAGYAIATLAMFVPHQYDSLHLRGVLSFVLVLLYFVYMLVTLKASSALVEAGHGTEAENAMYLARLRLPVNLFTIVVQLGLGLTLLVWGAEGFIDGVAGASSFLHISPLLLSLLIIPIATELPEKINSILWVRRDKDTLAFGNITGAMVFQGTLLPAIGIALTPWVPRPEVFLGLVITLVAACWLRHLARHPGGIRIRHLMLNGVLYASYLVLAITLS